MNIKDININIVLLVIVILVIAFFAGKYLFNVYGVKQPLVKELKNIEGVKKVDLINNDGKTDINVNFKSGIDFERIYQKISMVSSNELGENKGDILVESDEDKSLEDIYYQIHFAIYEGISTNRYTVMMKNIENELADSNINYKLWVNDDNLLLRLDRNGNSLYKIISRKNKGGVDSG